MKVKILLLYPMGLVTGGCLVDVQRSDGVSVEVDEVGEIVVGERRG